MQKILARLIVLVFVLGNVIFGFSLAQEAPDIISRDNVEVVGNLSSFEADATNAIAFHPNSQFLAYNDDDDVLLWDIAANESIETGFDDNNLGIGGLFFNPEGQVVVSSFAGVSEEHEVAVWDYENEESINVLSVNNWFGTVLSPDGETLAVASCSGNIEIGQNGMLCSSIPIDLIDMSSGNVIRTLNGMADTIWSFHGGMVFSPDGTMLAAGSGNGSVSVFDVETGRRNNVYTSGSYRVFGVAFGPDNSSLAIALGDGSIVIVDVESGDELVSMEHDNSPVISVAFSPDGSLLASAGADGSIRLWDVETGDELMELDDHGDIVYIVIFSPDGSLLASAGIDETIRIWGIADPDNDEVIGDADNCPSVANEDQEDEDEDGFGDACDVCLGEAGTVDGCFDNDSDGIADADDNCELEANEDQADFNSDGIGDVCQDSDGDIFMDAEDQCPDEAGTLEGCPDEDEDSIADAEDQCPTEAGTAATEGCPDEDEDRVADAEDNCVSEANRDQDDFNSDGTGDACQDSDEDTFLDAVDECQEEAGTLEGCPDSDEDGISDADDECPSEAGTAATEGCPDGDEDGISDADDECPSEAGTAATEGCPDSDEDGVRDTEDECPDEAGMPEANGCFYTATVSGGSTINMRTGPGTNFSVVTGVSADDTLLILGRNEASDWLFVRIVDEESEEITEGWVAAWLVTTDAVIEELPIVSD